MGQAARLAVRAAAVLVALPLLWFAAGLVGAAIPWGGASWGGTIEIRLLGTAIHDDILLPATPETRAAFAFAAGAGVPVDDPRAAWILAGWGARRFYTTTGTYADVEAGAVWRAATGDASVLRVDALPAWDGAGTVRLRMAPENYRRLVAAITASRAGPALAHRGFTPTDRFFEGRGRFDARRTCNVWVGEVFRAAGLRFGRWTPTPQATRLALAFWARTGAPDDTPDDAVTLR